MPPRWRERVLTDGGCHANNTLTHTHTHTHTHRHAHTRMHTDICAHLCPLEHICRFDKQNSAIAKHHPPADLADGSRVFVLFSSVFHPSLLLLFLLLFWSAHIFFPFLSNTTRSPST